jgi:catechol 2,3-dioxygenase-like lactoylglutathione lyase family enzyme
MSRVQLALRVSNLTASIDFYTKLFGTPPAKDRPGYANFAITEPPLKLVLIEGQPGEDTRMDHLGIEVETTEEVTACCYALQDKVWVTGPGQEPWEVYTVKGDATTLARQEGSACC